YSCQSADPAKRGGFMLLTLQPAISSQLRLSLFRRCVMIVAQHSRDLPRSILVLPQVHESPLAHAFRILMARMMKTVHTHFNRSEPLHVKHLQSPWHQFPRNFAADIFLHALRQRRSTQSHAALIVI